MQEMEREKRKRDLELHRIQEERARMELDKGKMEKSINNLKDEVTEFDKQTKNLKLEAAQNEMQNSELHRKLSQSETRARNSMKMFMDMREDRDQQISGSSQLQSELAEKEKAIDKLLAEKERILKVVQTKDKKIEALDQNIKTISDEKEELYIEFAKQKRRNNELESLLKTSDLKTEQLNRFLDRNEIAQQKRDRSMTNVINDRDVIGRQLIEKENEVQQLHRENASWKICF